ncbi:unnamed protein product [Cylindrotheca closterium]|uniref:Uncharacterized protein n=1 Tax=Cylindrotheca closterium TaxID=2856 RepID=A0AAD2FN01_9STRA|nr:unnamed protein product [Cylindrotheca closterium]
MKSQIIFAALLAAAAVATEATNDENTAKVEDTHKVQRELRPVRIYDNPTTEGSWGHCEGDCDVDDDCYHNLICFQRQENEATPVPGCKGGDEDFSANDYCVFPGDIPLSGNLFEQHTGDNLNDEPVDDLSQPTGQTTILSAENPENETATDPPLSLVGQSGVSSLSQQFISMTLMSLVSAAVLTIQA